MTVDASDRVMIAFLLLLVIATAALGFLSVHVSMVSRANDAELTTRVATVASAVYSVQPAGSAYVLVQGDPATASHALLMLVPPEGPPQAEAKALCDRIARALNAQGGK